MKQQKPAENLQEILLSASAGGPNGQIVFLVTVTPKSSINQLTGIDRDGEQNRPHLKVKIRGLPTDGQVNENLLRFLSKKLNLAPSSISIVSGHHSRRKILTIDKNALS
jgi:hypothetical protein